MIRLLWWVSLVLLVGCAADWRSQGVQDLWSTRVGAWLLRWEYAGMQVQRPDPAHADALTKAQNEPRRPYLWDISQEVW
jgi:hypothetical protein